MKVYEVRNLWVDTFAAFNSGRKDRYNSVGYFDRNHRAWDKLGACDDTWVEVARFADSDYQAADAEAERLDMEEERSAQWDTHGVALQIETTDEGETILSLMTEGGATVSAFRFDGPAVESMGIAFRVLYHRAERDKVFEALLARYRSVGMEYHC